MPPGRRQSRASETWIAAVVDLVWPADLAPYRVAFYLRPHVGGQESPLNRQKKTYGLSAPRWVARLAFRGGYDGAPRFGEPDGFGARLDSLIADLEGGLNLAVFHDWRRPLPTAPLSVTGTVKSGGAAAGATSMIVSGLASNSRAFSIGDYIGGDGRPHIVSAAATIAAGGAISGAGSLVADASGLVVVGFKPPLSAAIPVGAPLQWPVTGRFELVNTDDAGQNETEVGQPTEYLLEFAEKLA
jgi:hypothetical protein